MAETDDLKNAVNYALLFLKNRRGVRRCRPSRSRQRTVVGMMAG